MTSYDLCADKALRDELLTRDECRDVLKTPDDRVNELLAAAFRVRERYFGKKVRLQMLLNAKSGACQEDCHYCSQSAVSTADIERYGLVSKEQMLDGARRAAASKAQRYCVVISGRSPLDREIEEISDAVRAVKKEIPIQVCCSLGLLNEQQARTLKAAGVDRINHNLNTSETYHAEICTTHTFQDRLATIRHARTAGLEICSGGIIGMGEQDEDVIDLALALRDVKPDSIPLNMLHPVEGTPLQDCRQLTPERCLK
ncbi:MAG: biotin synthase BioB, partial [Nitrospiraceae bacterium]